MEYSAPIGGHPSPAPLVIIGSGPAGLMVASRLAAAGFGARTLIFDHKKKAGLKFLLAGRSGLNLTHSTPLDSFIQVYRPTEWMAPYIQAFPPAALRDFADSLGQETFVGSSGRVFPTAWRGTGFLRAWLSHLSQAGVRFIPEHRLIDWHQGNCTFISPDPQQKGKKIKTTLAAQATVLALGGASWPRFGADAGWIPLATKLGLKVTPFRPSNMGFQVAWSPYMQERFAGTALKNVQLRYGGQQARGDLILTQTGIESGPLYPLSGPLRDAIDQKGSARVHLNFKPDTISATLCQQIEKTPKKASFSQLCKRLKLPAVFPTLCREMRLERPEKPRDLAHLVQNFPLPLCGYQGLERAISADGGLCLNELDQNLQTRKHPGLYALGEMLDWDAPTGGYLLQACFSQGAWVGDHLCSVLNKT